MSYVPPNPPPYGANAIPAEPSGGRILVGLALSLGPELFLGLLNLVTEDGWPWLLLLLWMMVCFVVGIVLAFNKRTTKVGAGLLIGASLGVIVAGGSCIGYLATTQASGL